MPVTIRSTQLSDIAWIKQVFISRWDGEFVLSLGKIHKPEDLEGYIAELDGKKVGLLTYQRLKSEIEITSIDVFVEHKGIGRELIKTVFSDASHKIRRIWLTTTNDNFRALKFYQKLGFHLIKVYPDVLKEARKLKPSIPLIGEDGIPLRDELELEKLV